MITARIDKKKGGGWDELRKYFTEISKDNVEVGYFQDQGIYPSERNTEGWTYAQLMAYHELECDTNLVPLRPVFQSVTKTDLVGIRKIAFKMLRNQLRGTYYHKMKGGNTPNTLYRMMGTQLGGLIRRRFNTVGLAKNAPSTIKSKGRNSPMIETGHLRDSVSYKTMKQRKSMRVFRNG